MISVTTVEIIFFLLTVLIWLGPWALSAVRRKASLIHPSSVLPIFLVSIVAVAMTEHWFGWSRRFSEPGLRLETTIFQSEPRFFTTPLLVISLVGIAYHLGVGMGCGRIVASHIDRIHLTGSLRSVASIRSRALFIVSGIAFFVCVMPFVIFGQGQGFFWTLGLLGAANFLPALVMSQSFSAGYVLFFLGTVAQFLLPSKGNFIFYVLPLFVFFQGKLLFQRSRFKARLLLPLVLALLLAYFGTIQLIRMRGEWVEHVPLASYVLTREYGFEVFALLVQKISWAGSIFSDGSWIIFELKELVPSALVPWTRDRVGVEVARVFMPHDYDWMPQAGFLRFLIFAFYHDLGWVGAILSGALYGLLFGRLYRWALVETYRRKAIWPLITYLPIPVYSYYFANGVIAFGVIFSLFGSAVVWLVALLTRVKFDLRREAKPSLYLAGSDPHALAGSARIR